MEEKMGPRIREDKKWGRFFTPIPRLHEGRLKPSPIEGEGISRRETGYFHSNDVYVRVSRRGNNREVRVHRMEEKMGPRIREDKKWGRFFTPIPRLHEGRLKPSPIEGEGISRRETGYFHSNDVYVRVSRRGNNREVRGHRMEEKMGPRIREDKKWGRFFTPIPRLHEGRLKPSLIEGEGC